MTDLTDFLLARIAEDEAVARTALRESSYGWSDNAFTEAVELAENEGAVEEATVHIARWDPSRVLAECEAKRRIMEEAREAFDLRDRYADDTLLMSRVYGGRGALADHMLRLLALPYADHPDYRQEWRP